MGRTLVVVALCPLLRRGMWAEISVGKHMLLLLLLYLGKYEFRSWSTNIMRKETRRQKRRKKLPDQVVMMHFYWYAAMTREGRRLEVRTFLEKTSIFHQNDVKFG